MLQPHWPPCSWNMAVCSCLEASGRLTYSSHLFVWFHRLTFVDFNEVSLYLTCHLSKVVSFPYHTIYKREKPCMFFTLCSLFLLLSDWNSRGFLPHSVWYNMTVYLVCVTWSWHRAPKTLRIPRVIGVPFVFHNKPFSITPKFMLTLWLRWEPLDSFRMGLVPGTTMSLEDWNF